MQRSSGHRPHEEGMAGEKCSVKVGRAGQVHDPRQLQGQDDPRDEEAAHWKEIWSWIERL